MKTGYVSLPGITGDGVYEQDKQHVAPCPRTDVNLLVASVASQQLGGHVGELHSAHAVTSFCPGLAGPGLAGRWNSKRGPATVLGA